MTVKKSDSGVLKATAKHMDLDLAFIASNIHQTRETVAPTLTKMGYGVLERQPAKEGEEQKPCLFELLLSDEGERRQEGLDLVKAHEKELWEFSDNLIQYGQLHPVGVTQIKDEEGRPQKKWNIVFGMRRTAAKAVVYAKLLGKAPRTVRATEIDWIDSDAKLFQVSLAENAVRKAEDPLEQGRYFMKLKAQGMNIKDIAAATGEGWQTVRGRMQLLNLPQPLQDQIASGEAKWSVVLQQHLDKLNEEEEGKEGKGKDKQTKPKKGRNSLGGRRGMPTVKQAEDAYLLMEKPDKMPEDEWKVITDEGARKYMAYYAGFEYLNRRDLKVKLAAEKQAEEARKAAEAAEKEEKGEKKGKKKGKK